MNIYLNKISQQVNPSCCFVLIVPKAVIFGQYPPKISISICDMKLQCALRTKMLINNVLQLLSDPCVQIREAIFSDAGR